MRASACWTNQRLRGMRPFLEKGMALSGHFFNVAFKFSYSVSNLIKLFQFSAFLSASRFFLWNFFYRFFLWFFYNFSSFLRNAIDYLLFSLKEICNSWVLLKIYSARKLVNNSFSWPVFFPVFGLNTEIYRVNLCIQTNYVKIRTRKNSAFRIFHAVVLILNARL